MPSLVIFKPQIFDNLKNVKLCPLITEIALITSDIEHIFMNILTIFSSIMLSVHIVAHFIFLDLCFWYLIILSIYISQYFLPDLNFFTFEKYTKEFGIHAFIYTEIYHFFFSVYIFCASIKNSLLLQ